MLNVSSMRSEVFDGDTLSCKLQALPAASLIETLQTTTAVWTVPLCTWWREQTSSIRPQPNPSLHTASHFTLIYAVSHRNFIIYLCLCPSLVRDIIQIHSPVVSGEKLKQSDRFYIFPNFSHLSKPLWRSGNERECYQNVLAKGQVRYFCVFEFLYHS